MPKKTLLELFGPKEKQYARRPDEECKPAGKLIDKIIEDTMQGGYEKVCFFYLGDQVTDVRFIESRPHAHGLVIPGEKRLNSIRDYLEDKPALKDRIRIVPRHLISSSEKLIEKLEADLFNVQKKLKIDHVYLGVDLDGTLHVKFDEAQSAAAEALGKQLQKKDPGVFTDYAVQFLRDYRSTFYGKAQGSDFQFALAIKCILDYARQYGRGPTNRSPIREPIIESVIARYAQDPKQEKKLVGDLTQSELAKIGFVDVLSFYVKIKSFSMAFRDAEAKESRKKVVDGSVFLYQEVVDALMHLQNISWITTGIVTNKPYNVLSAIYDVPFNIQSIRSK